MNLKNDKFVRLLRYGRPYLFRLLTGFFLIVVTAQSGLVMPLVQKFVIDDVLSSAKQPKIAKIFFGKSYSCSPFIWLTLVLAFIIAFHLFVGVLSYIRSYLMTWVSQRVLFDMRNQVFAHLQDLSMRFFDTQGVGQIMSRITGDVNSLSNIVTSTTIGIITDAIMFVTMLVILLKWNWPLTLMSLVVLPLFAINYYLFIGKMRVLWRALRHRWAEISGGLYEAVAGARVVKAFHMEKHEERKVFKSMRQTYKYDIQLAKLSTLMGSIAGLFQVIGTGIVLWYGGYLVVKGIFTVGTMIAFYSYLSRMYGPMMNLINVNTTIQSTMVSAERVFGLLDSQPTVEEAPDAVPLPEIKGYVNFDNVSFSYDPEKPVLHEVNFEVKPDMMVALVGPSGCGKTTVVNLLARFYDPTSGAIYIDGHDLRKVTIKSVRNQIGVVLQESFLFKGSVADNIRYGRMNATDQEVVRASIDANAHKFIVEDLAEGYETDVGERGGRLSGGQKQRVAIARTILRNPRILILDEATSALDSEAEFQIQEALERLMKGKTTFVIAHRLSTVMKADMIIVLKEGRVVEIGAHAQLVATGGMYSEMFKKQFRIKQEADELWLK